MLEIRWLLLEDMALNDGTQLRSVDDPTVANYRAVLREGTAFPPIVVFTDGNRYWPADGFHRIQACLDERRAKIEAEVFPGNRRDAIRYALSANTDHGRIRLPEELRSILFLVFADPEWGMGSDGDIALLCKVRDRHTVAKYRKEFLLQADIPPVTTRTVHRGGKQYTMDTAAIGKSSTPKAVGVRELARMSPEEQLDFYRLTHEDEDVDAEPMPAKKRTAPKERLCSLSVRVPSVVMERLRELAKQRNQTRDALVAQAIMQFGSSLPEE